ncbi:MAG: hypothetical protein S4CHLAM6_07720 [Chlamydiae bacterium]|nr:hypothetical protein [Chlamydiota bacterium]
MSAIGSQVRTLTINFQKEGLGSKELSINPSLLWDRVASLHLPLAESVKPKGNYSSDAVRWASSFEKLPQSVEVTTRLSRLTIVASMLSSYPESDPDEPCESFKCLENVTKVHLFRAPKESIVLKITDGAGIEFLDESHSS